MTKLQEIKDEVVKVYPELIEKETILAELWDTINERGDGVFGKIPKEKWKLANEIFNPEITLEHILEVVSKIKKTPLEKHEIVLRLVYSWFYIKPLSEQSTENINLIHSLLFEK